ncbi:MAG: branched-chain amino acid transport system substrate-binding protein [Hyphomicrobiales bacterium]|jgi:branched-chain amino acid transport system substrate-binding protein|nr:branched-chain amino acid transport system substrate-binding protein [Hyphomicrobiales bacterium]
MNLNKRMLLTSAVAGFALAVAAPALAQKKYDPGASDTEIKIGNINPYSGPASAYGLIGKTIEAYFKKVNAEGGINGRKVNFISYDDGYSPPKAVEQTRKLVESDEVLLVFQPLGTPSNTAIQKYMNSKKVPQLFVATGATKWGDPKNFPWTMGWQPTYQAEGQIYAKYILKNHPNAKIGILYQNDDYGKDYVKGLKDGLGEKAKTMIVSELPYEPADPTVDSQIVSLKGSGADVFFNVTTPKFAAQAIKKAHEIGWKPLHLLNNVSQSVGSVLKPAGFEAAKDVLSTGYLKDPTDSTWNDDAGKKEWLAFMDKYFPDGDKTSSFTVYGYTVAQTLHEVLKQAGDNLTRENVMKQAANLKNVTHPMLLPGITINTSEKDFYPIEQMQMQKFNGERWEMFGPIINGGGEGS